MKRWYFAVDRARGDGWDVIDADGAPLSERELRIAVGEGGVASTASEHRAAVDRLLFGLGDRYDAMVELASLAAPAHARQEPRPAAPRQDAAPEPAPR